MKRICTAVLLTVGLFSASTWADAHKQVMERKVVIETMGGEADHKAIMKKVEAAIGDDTHANVMVTVDDKGEVTVKKLAPGEALPLHKGEGMEHEVIMTKIHEGMQPPHGPMHMVRKAHARKSLAPEAAQCVLKHIGKVSSDAGARLLRDACTTIAEKQ